jgi:hypothetical protein
MKKAFAILFASLVLLSGMHLSVASHLCCGELAAVKCSFTGEKATCGMEDHQSPCSSNGVIEADCCKNQISTCKADNNYFPTSTEATAVHSIAAPLFNVLPIFLHTASVLTETYYSMVGPPVLKPFNSVERSFIGVIII